MIKKYSIEKYSCLYSGEFRERFKVGEGDTFFCFEVSRSGFNKPYLVDFCPNGESEDGNRVFLWSLHNLASAYILCRRAYEFAIVMRDPVKLIRIFKEFC